jgi:three-Cys-motif partner protein
MADQTHMFPDFPLDPDPVVNIRSLKRPVWTEHKARLIARYLRYFVFITKHGTYIDGFAGPQGEDKADAANMWSARLVLANEPRWLRKFYLYDISDRQANALGQLVAKERELDERLRTQGEKQAKRFYHAQQADFNEAVDGLLLSGDIKQKEATFALLDQRSIECAWATVAKLAGHCKPPHRKIELFYFLATGWLDRTIAAHSAPDAANAWWGSDSWQALRHSSGERWMREVVRRFKEELGHRYAMAWPIRELEHGKGRTMYHMIHATDHPEAVKLMHRAYNHVLDPLESGEQLELALGQQSSPG